jgi:hypothetical protein
MQRLSVRRNHTPPSRTACIAWIVDFNIGNQGFNKKSVHNGETITTGYSDILQTNVGYAVVNTRIFNRTRG